MGSTLGLGWYRGWQVILLQATSLEYKILDHLTGHFKASVSTFQKKNFFQLTKNQVNIKKSFRSEVQKVYLNNFPVSLSMLFSLLPNANCVQQAPSSIPPSFQFRTWFSFFSQAPVNLPLLLFLPSWLKCDHRYYHSCVHNKPTVAKGKRLQLFC